MFESVPQASPQEIGDGGPIEDGGGGGGYYGGGGGGYYGGGGGYYGGGGYGGDYGSGYTNPPTSGGFYGYGAYTGYASDGSEDDRQQSQTPDASNVLSATQYKSTPDAYEAGLESNPVIQQAEQTANSASNWNNPNQQDRTEAGFEAFMQPDGSIVAIPGTTSEGSVAGYNNLFTPPPTPDGDTAVFEYHTHPFTATTSAGTFSQLPDISDLNGLDQGAVGVVGTQTGNYYYGKGH